MIININKNYGVIVLAIIVSIIFSNLLIDGYEDETVMKSEGNVYLLQYGAYTDIEVLNENVKKLTDYVIYKEDDKYYVYLGVFTNYENAYRVSKIFDNDNIYTFIKSDYVNNSDLIDKIIVLDKKVIIAKKESEVRSLNKEMLSIYKKHLNL